VSALSEALTRNWNLKLSALGLAVFLWAVVRAEPTEREVLSSVPVRVQVADLGWTLAAAPDPAQVQVRFAGPTRDILSLDRERASVRFMIEAVSGSDTVVQLRRDWVVVDGATGLVVQDIVPGSVRLTFEPTSQDVVPLAVRTRGRLPRGLALAAPIGLTPSVIRVRGPARVVDSLQSIPLRVVDLSDVTASGMMEVAVDTAGLSELTFAQGTAQLGLRVEPAAEMLLPAVPVEVEGPAAAALDTEPLSLPVTVRGARGRLDGAILDSVRIRVAADRVQDVAPGESRRVPVSVVGLPALLEAEIPVDSVTVRRPRATSEGGPRPDTTGAGG
jgi:YbbR domain-containing protein